MKNIGNHGLLTIMEKCGHFLYHRRGGKRGQGRILRILCSQGEMTQKELQEYLGIQSGSMSEIILKLEGSGLICRMRDEKDRRKIKVQVTKAGKQLYEKEIKERMEEEKSLFNALSDEEQEQLEKLLNKLFEDWESKFDRRLFEHRKGGKGKC